MEKADTTKVCTKCGTEYPTATGYFYYRKDNNTYRNDCKKCNIARGTHYASQNVVRTRERKHKWYKDNFERIAEDKKIKYQQNRDNIRARQKEYRENNKEVVVEWKRKYYIKNKDRVLQKHKEYRDNSDKVAVREYMRKWVKDHPDNIRAIAHRRRDRMVSPTPVRTEHITTQMLSQRRKCWWCGEEIYGNRYHIDHVIPLSRGGFNSPDNIVISCPLCNQSKHNKMPWEFAGRLL